MFFVVLVLVLVLVLVFGPVFDGQDEAGNEDAGKVHSEIRAPLTGSVSILRTGLSQPWPRCQLVGQFSAATRPALAWPARGCPLRTPPERGEELSPGFGEW